MVSTTCYATCIRISNQIAIHETTISKYVKNIDLDVHIKVFEKAIKTNGEMLEANIINLFGFTLRDTISEWGENYVQDHPNCTFEELQQAFCKRFKIVKNNEEVYMQLQNIQQQIAECVEVYYEPLLKRTLMEHKKATIICEESGPISLS